MKFSNSATRLIDPLARFEANKVTAHDYVPDGPKMAQMVDRIKTNFAYDLFPRLTEVRATIYVFSEQELKSLLYSLTEEKGSDTL